MTKFQHFLSKALFTTTGYCYNNMAKLFIRLFVGVMFMQFGIRHLMNFSQFSIDFPSMWGMSSATTLTLMIIIELVCSLLIMVGFLTRLSTIPPIASMIAAEYYIVHDMLPNTSIYGIDCTQPGYLPVMFIGIYCFILLAGPGKISLDYFISPFLINRQGRDEKYELEDV